MGAIAKARVRVGVALLEEALCSLEEEDEDLPEEARTGAAAGPLADGVGDSGRTACVENDSRFAGLLLAQLIPLADRIKTCQHQAQERRHHRQQHNQQQHNQHHQHNQDHQAFRQSRSSAGSSDCGQGPALEAPLPPAPPTVGAAGAGDTGDSAGDNGARSVGAGCEDGDGDEQAQFQFLDFVREMELEGMMVGSAS